ncbi:MAG: phage tail tape measure protein [Deltaproteobacteria bacterium]|nr:phage tail tape measure protein [Deltaproteobacteria bacterium]
MGLKDIISGKLFKIQKQVKSTNRSVGALSMGMAKLAKLMLPLAIAAGIVVGAFGACTASTIATQSALGELASVGISDMQALSNEAEKFSDTWAGTTKPQFLAAAYDIKSGISSLSDEGVAKFTSLSALTGKATKSTVAEMTSLFATAYGIFKDMYAGMSDMDFGEMFSAGIAASVKNFKTTGAGMSAAISQLGATATTAKVPMEEQLTILGMLQKTMTGSEAGTKYKALMQSAASAGEKLNLQFLDANNNLKSLPDILTVLRKKYGSELDEMEKMKISEAFGTKEAVAVIDLFYSKVDGMKENIAGLSVAMGKGSEFTAEMARTMNMDLGAVLQILGQQFNNLKEVIGKAFIPILAPVVSWIGKIIMVVKDFAKTELGQRIIQISAAIAVAIIGFTGLVAAIAMIGFAAPLFAAGMATIGATLSAFAWPILIIIGVVTLLYSIFKNNFGGIAKWWKKLSLVFRGVWAVFSTMKDGVGVIRGELADDIEAEGLVGLVTKIAKIGYRIKTFFGGFMDGFKESFAGIYEIFRPVINAVGSLFKEIWGVISEVTSELTGATAKSDVESWKSLGNVIGTVVAGGFKLLAYAIRITLFPFQKMCEFAAQFIKYMREKGYIKAFANSIKSSITFLTDLFNNIDLKAAGIKMMETFADGIKTAVSSVYNEAKIGLAKVRKLLPFSDAKEGPLSTLTLSGQRMMETMGTGIKMAAPGLRNTVAAALAGVMVVTAQTDAKEVPQPELPFKQEIETSKKESKKTVIINIENINLPEVKDAEDFLKQIQEFVEGKDVLDRE